MEVASLHHMKLLTSLLCYEEVGNEHWKPIFNTKHVTTITTHFAPHCIHGRGCHRKIVPKSMAAIAHHR